MRHEMSEVIRLLKSFGEQGAYVKDMAIDYHCKFNRHNDYEYNDWVTVRSADDTFTITINGKVEH